MLVVVYARWILEATAQFNKCHGQRGRREDSGAVATKVKPSQWEQLVANPGVGTGSVFQRDSESSHRSPIESEGGGRGFYFRSGSFLDVLPGALCAERGRRKRTVARGVSSIVSSDKQRISPRIDKYCAAHRNETLETALNELVKELRAMR
jgi:hypothetical protein